MNRLIWYEHVYQMIKNRQVKKICQGSILAAWKRVNKITIKELSVGRYPYTGEQGPTVKYVEVGKGTTWSVVSQ